MKIAIMTDIAPAASAVYSVELISEMREKFELCDKVLSKKDLEDYSGFLKETEYLFSTWGMPRFTKSEIKKYFPKLKSVLYAAGSVQGFAREFLESNISVHSAWVANGIPVAEFTFAQIILAGKKYFNKVSSCNQYLGGENAGAETLNGNYRIKVGVCGAGVIGSMVCEKLKSLDCEVFVFDRFLSDERAKELKVKLVSLEEIFSECDVITNHLADKNELAGIYDYELFNLMKNGATFINTGRGRQVNEPDLVKAFTEDKSKTALLDVTFPEPPQKDSPILKCNNIFITPHIAGSTGNECYRLADFMFEEFIRVTGNRPSQYEVTLKMLSTMA